MQVRKLLWCGALVLFVFSSIASAAPIVIDDVPGPYPATSGDVTFDISTTGSIGSASNASYGLYGQDAGGRDERYFNGNASDVATWAPNISGNYNVYVHWMRHTSHEPNAVYTVNHAAGSTAQTFAQNRVGNQTASGPLTGADFSASGWVPLGNFNLNAGSSVTLTHPTLGGFLVADAVRFHNPLTDGLLIDERVFATATGGGVWQQVNSHPTTDPNGYSIQYLYTLDANQTITYTPGLAGWHSLDLSWGVYSTHATDAQYTIDLDGNLATTGDQSIVNINQSLYANQVTGSNNALLGQWSGFRNAGLYNLTLSSIIQLRRAGGGAAPLSADVLLATPVPEPSTAVMLGIALVSMAGGVRRARARSIFAHSSN